MSKIPPKYASVQARDDAAKAQKVRKICERHGPYFDKDGCPVCRLLKVAAGEPKLREIRVTLGVEVSVLAENEDQAVDVAVRAIEEGVIAAETVSIVGKVEVVAP